jgi:hypothetical protein
MAPHCLKWYLAYSRLTNGARQANLNSIFVYLLCESVFRCITLIGLFFPDAKLAYFVSHLSCSVFLHLFKPFITTLRSYHFVEASSLYIFPFQCLLARRKYCCRQVLRNLQIYFIKAFAMLVSNYCFPWLTFNLWFYRFRFSKAFLSADRLSFGHLFQGKLLARFIFAHDPMLMNLWFSIMHMQFCRIRYRG